MRGLRQNHHGPTTGSRPGRAQPALYRHLGMLYALGLSHRGVEGALRLLGYGVDQVTSWRDRQRLGRAGYGL